MCDISSRRSFVRVKEIVLAMLTTTALCMDMSIPHLQDGQKIGKMTEILWNLKASFDDKALLSVCAFVCCYVLYRHIDGKRASSRTDWLFLTVNAGLAGIWLMAEGFRRDNSLLTLYASGGQLIKATMRPRKNLCNRHSSTV